MAELAAAIGDLAANLTGRTGVTATSQRGKLAVLYGVCVSESNNIWTKEVWFEFS